MKHLFVLFHLVILSFGTVHSQTLELDINNLNSAESCAEQEQNVLLVANLILSTPYPELDRGLSGFVLKWMECTDRYTFEIGETEMKAIGDETGLLGVVLAAYAADAIENEEVDRLSAVTRFLEYAENEAMEVPQHSGIKKMLRDKRKGKLADRI
ncbi:MAG: hypothetical protein AAFP08_11510 [Bacteroidota bacterium]